jgi:hypothetical protein
MKIVDIFAEYKNREGQLFSVIYPNENDNYGKCEFEKLLDLWTNVEYLRDYAISNNIINVNQFVRSRLRDAEAIEDLIDELFEQNEPLDIYFQQLSNFETGVKLLSLRKGKTSRRDGLRIYAIKIDDNCFLITGGAIKMSQKNDDHPDTRQEMRKIAKVKSYLQSQDVFDEDSFYELLIELNDDE